MPWFLPRVVFIAFCAGRLLAQSAALAGIAHLSFRVTDVARSRSFYPGFEEAFRFATPARLLCPTSS
jgi:hypothetical protein